VWGGLAAFHVWLLAEQAWNGQVEYAEFVRWALALGLVGALVALRRHGGSLFGDRRAAAIWVLVALLHGPVLAEGAGLATQALTETPAVVAQIVCAAAGLGLALAWAARGDSGHAIDRATLILAVWLRPVHTLDVHPGLGFLPRPPPLA
jgi:hypothetical protein